MSDQLNQLRNSFVPLVAFTRVNMDLFVVNFELVIVLIILLLLLLIQHSEV